MGIGADQSYSFVAIARSRWAWIFDYDPAVVRLHYVLRALILENDSPHGLVRGLAPERLPQTAALTARSLAADIAAGRLDADDGQRVRDELPIWAEAVYYRYQRRLKPAPGREAFDWLGHPEHYRYVRTMFQQGRIVVRKGNLLTPVVLPAMRPLTPPGVGRQSTGTMCR